MIKNTAIKMRNKRTAYLPLYPLRFAFRDPYNYKYHGIVSFRAAELLDTPQDSVLLRIKYRGLEQDETVDLTWIPQENKLIKPELNPVSYTHLTLPTNSRV